MNNDIWAERMNPHHSRTGDHRTPADIDYARVIHSESFRRLAGVTQILALNDSDFHRNRLTHSIEVGQVALGIVQQLKAESSPQIQELLPNRAQMETISFIHDLGHPPFGHGGETALMYAMRQHGGFEGNGQTLRILANLTSSSSTKRGANLTRRTLLGSLKYPVPYSMVARPEVMNDCISPINGRVMLSGEYHDPPKCYLDTEQDVVDWLMTPFSEADRSEIIRTRAKSFDCTIMDISDDIAYGVHDLEDAITLGLVTPHQLTKDVDPSLWREFLEIMAFDYPSDYDRRGTTSYNHFLSLLFETDTKSQIGRLVHYMIQHAQIQIREEFDEPMYRHAAVICPPANALLNALKKFIYRRVIQAPVVQQLRHKGQRMIIELFAELQHSPRHLLPSPVYSLYSEQDTQTGQMRVICDYIASLTDAGLVRVYKRLFDPGAGSVFDNLR